VTGDINQDYLDHLGEHRSDQAKARRESDISIIEMHNAV
jgi:hypothetical protein